MAHDTNLLCVVHHFDQDTFEQQSDDRLAFVPGGCCGLPECGQILRKIADRVEFRRAWRRQPFTPNAFVVGLQSRLFGQRLLPSLIERARHQPIARSVVNCLPAMTSISRRSRPASFRSPDTVIAAAGKARLTASSRLSGVSGPTFSLSTDMQRFHDYSGPRVVSISRAPVCMSGIRSSRMSEVQLDYICLAQTPTAPISGSVLMLCPQSVQMAT